MICVDCKKEKDIFDFYKKGERNGLTKFTTRCKECHKKKYFIDNKEAKREYAKKYRMENPDKWYESQKKYRSKNKEKLDDHKRSVRDKTNKRVREWRRKRKDEGGFVVHIEKIRRMIGGSIRRMNQKKMSKSWDIIGCTPEEFKFHIEIQFRDGMSWDNYGFNGWHYDHIIPLSSAKNYEDLIRLNHYTNFQPLWWHENISKSNKIIEQNDISYDVNSKDS